MRFPADYLARVARAARASKRTHYVWGHPRTPLSSPHLFNVPLDVPHLVVRADGSTSPMGPQS